MTIRSRNADNLISFLYLPMFICIYSVNAVRHGSFDIHGGGLGFFFEKKIPRSDFY